MTELEKMLIDAEKIIKDFKDKFTTVCNKLEEEEKRITFEQARKEGCDEMEFYIESGFLLSDMGYSEEVEERFAVVTELFGNIKYLSK